MGSRTPCIDCKKRSRGKRCVKCHEAFLGGVQRVIVEEAKVAPVLVTNPKIFGDFVIISDPHMPFHDPKTIDKACEASRLLGITSLVIAGDLMQMDAISRYVNAGKLVRLSQEIISCGRVLHALSGVFDEIHIIMGNHDQRLERFAAALLSSSEGRKSFELTAKILDVDENPESVAYGILHHFFDNEKVKLYPLPQLTVNGRWIVMHPGSCSRIAPQTERRMVAKFRKPVIGGHNHLFGIGFDESGQDVAANIGHCSDPSKMRYIHEKITTFPAMNQGFCCIVRDDTAPHGRIIPIAVHDQWFDLAALAKRLGDNVESM